MFDFDLVHLDFLPDFPELFFLFQYLSIFWESTLAGVSIYIQESTLGAQSKALVTIRIVIFNFMIMMLIRAERLLSVFSLELETGI